MTVIDINQLDIDRQAMMVKDEYSHRAVIHPVPDGERRPLWSVMIPTYNCANYLRETLASVLAQDPGPDLMQIEVVDDHSTKDDPEAVVRELAGDRVSFYRQPENVGYIKNFETCLQRSRGQLIHLLHGDDCVRDGFYRKMQQAFVEKPETGLAFCRYIFMDEHGNWQSIYPLEQSNTGILNNALEMITTKASLQVASVVVRRDVYEKLGGFDRRMTCYGEDWEMWVRTALHYPVWYETEPLALYRLHSSSLTGNSMRTGKNIQDIRQACDICNSYLPQPIGTKLMDKARENFAIFAIRTARTMFSKGDLSAANSQIKEAFKCSQSPKVVKAMIDLCIWVIKFSLRQQISKTILFKYKSAEN